MVTNYIVCLPV